ncbi:hypothetical protein [Paenibacillus luteus]|uniref:hypothetical protein n=1 Tax=Paenibacillus luteus TaxID=2545753 RepID=UPI0019D56E67|nr:hypothetical protein [Paenibacillus luteus]
MEKKEARRDRKDIAKYRLLFREDGAVTVFSVIVLSTLLLFFSLLIDYARIAALHKLTEDAVRSSVRSVLSAYDTNLYEKYGLFGRGGTEGQKLFAEVLAANGEGPEGSDQNGMRMVRYKLESSTLLAASFLGSHDVFARQVLEEMKYKAPIDFTLELAAKFVPIAGAMKEASVTVNLLESMRSLYEKREAHLDRVLELQKQSASEVEASGIPEMIPIQLQSAAGDHTAYGLASGYFNYEAKVRQLETQPAADQDKAAKEIEALEDKMKMFGNEISRSSDVMLKQAVKRQEEATKELEAARLLNEEMLLLVQQADGQPEHAGYDAVSEAAAGGLEPNEVPAGAAADIKQMKEAADELVKTEEWFTDYKKELEGQGAAAADIERAAAGFQTISLAAVSKPTPNAAGDQLDAGAARLRRAYVSYEQNYIRPASILSHRRESLEQGDLKKKLKQQEEQVGSLWKKARSMLNGLNTVPQSEEHMQVFEQVRELYHNNMLFNQQTTEASQDVAFGVAGDAHEAVERSTALTGSLFTGIGNVLERTRDTLYFGEYVVHRYSYFAPEHLRSLLVGGNSAELSDALKLQNQEAEYIIYGFHHPAANIAAAYGELFAARLVIRTMEGLIESRSLGHPLLILSAALIYGLEKTLEDMVAFTEQGSAPLSKYVKVDLSYTDYLRLFSLMHGAEDRSSMARMIAVIEQKSGVVLSAVPIAVTGEAKISMPLWFVPGVMRIIGGLGLLEGKVVGNRYETTQTIGGSY